MHISLSLTNRIYVLAILFSFLCKTGLVRKDSSPIYKTKKWSQTVLVLGLEFLVSDMKI